MKLKKMLSLLAAAAMAVTALTVSMSVSVVSAADSYVTSGKIGENASWVINTDDVLVISGQGEINGSGGWGWINGYNTQLIDEVVVEDGITSVTNTISTNWALIGSMSCSYVSKITLPPSLTKLQGCLDFVGSFRSHHLKDIYIYSKNITDTAYHSLGYPVGITWHVYKDSETDKSLRNDLGLTDEDIEYIPDNEKMPAITNKTPAQVEPLTNTSGPAGLTSKWEWNESSKTLTFSGTGYIYGYGDKTTDFTAYKKYAETTEHIVIKPGITSIGLYGFIQTDTYGFNGAFCNFTTLKDVELPDTLRIIGDGIFGKSNLTKIELPQTVEKIGERAFEYTELEEISFSENIKSMGLGAFKNTKLKSINLHEGMSIGGGAFGSCESLKEVIIPPNCTYEKTRGQGGSREHATFSYCTGLEKVIIEDGVTDLAAESMFNVCTALKDVYFYTDSLQSIIGPNSGVSAELLCTFPTYKNITFHVVKGSKTEQTLKEAGYLTDENTEYITDTSALEAAITEAEEIDTSKYTDETVAALTTAVENGKALLENIDATQEAVDQAVTAVKDAISALKEKVEEPTDEPPTDEPPTDEPTEPETQEPTTEPADVTVSVTPDKAYAMPGDEVTYTVHVDTKKVPLYTVQMRLVIPEGMTYVENSGAIVDGVQAKLGYDNVAWTEQSLIINGYASAPNAVDSFDLATFKCKVDEGVADATELAMDLTYLEFTEEGFAKIANVAVAAGVVTVGEDPNPTEPSTEPTSDDTTQAPTNGGSTTTPTDKPAGNNNNNNNNNGNNGGANGTGTSATDKPVNTGAPAAVGLSAFLAAAAIGIVAMKKKNR